jgi:glutathione synthase
MNIGFVMYEWEKVSLKLDSTLRLIQESISRGHKVSLIYPNEMAIRRTSVWANCRIVSSSKPNSQDNFEFYNSCTLVEEFIPINRHQVIFFRDNPPIDAHVLNFMDTLENEIFFINSISGLRKANNKIYPATLATLHDNDNPNKRLIPLTTVSRNKKYLKQVIEAYDLDKFIIKPLDGFGGSGVILMDKSSKTSKYNVNSLLDFYINQDGKNNYIILQEYIETELKGDIRVIMLNGKPIGSMRRVPAKDDHRSNVHAGGYCVEHNLNKMELELCEIIGPKLVEDGLFLVGLDLMGEKLIEVNVCSPGGFVEINQTKDNDEKLQKSILNFIEEIIEKRSLKI